MYRDDLEAAQARSAALEAEVEQLEKRKRELEADAARVQALESENAALRAKIAPAPRVEIDEATRARWRAEKRRRFRIKLIGTLVVLGVIGACLLDWFGDGGGVVGLVAFIVWFIAFSPGQWERRYSR